jgi:hypothetical protein
MTLPGVLRRLRGRWKVRRRYRNEIRLLAGGLVGRPDRPSVVLHTVERAASRFVSLVLGRLARHAGLVPIDVDSYHYEIGRIRPWIEGGRGGASHPFAAPGCFYGPLRTASDNVLRLPHKAILVVRDPRDVLVSLHHNHAWEPRTPIAGGDDVAGEVEREMREARAMTLDAFVCHMARPDSHVMQTFRAYRTTLLRSPRVLVTRYETMLGDPVGWLEGIVHHLDWSPNRALREEVLGSDPLRQASRAGSGLREARPGAHARDLAPETRPLLAERLSDVLQAFGYEP